ncbi:MAG TPA: hypothetical protein VFK04_08940 [Gemmatimonadaceae bacterium]|nr:hypothetical protein [Gemmatimonadaceae bacterium]
MRSMGVGSLAAAIAAVVVLSAGAGALHAQQSSDDGRMRASNGYEGGGRRWSIVPGERIARVDEEGTLIELRDGTVWEVFLPDRTSTVGWQEGDFLIVKKAPLGQNIGQDSYTYELINGRTKERAVVSFRGRSG